MTKITLEELLDLIFMYDQTFGMCDIALSFDGSIVVLEVPDKFREIYRLNIVDSSVNPMKLRRNN